MDLLNVFNESKDNHHITTISTRLGRNPHFLQYFGARGLFG